MSRFTDKKVLGNFKAIKNIVPDYVASKEELIYDKLGKLEDLEEQLGCPLEIYTKLVYDTPIYDKNGYEGLVNAIKIFDYYDYGKRYVVEVIYFAKEEGAKNVIRAFPLEDYKKTWWLKENREE